MNARFTFVRIGLMLLAVAILGGCATQPKPVVPTDWDGMSRFDRRGDFYHTPPRVLEEQTVVRTPEGRVLHFSTPPRNLRGTIISGPNDRLGQSYTDSGMRRPTFHMVELTKMSAEVEAALQEERCRDVTKADDMLGNVAGGAAAGAVVGGVANGPMGAAAGVAFGALVAAINSRNMGRFTCQQLLDYRHMVRRDMSANRFLADDGRARCQQLAKDVTEMAQCAALFPERK